MDWNKLPREWRYSASYPNEFIIGDLMEGRKTISSYRSMNHMAFMSLLEPKNVFEALKDSSWINAMQEELNQFERSSVWKLVPAPHDQSIIDTKWVFKNKHDEAGNVVRNKSRMVAQGYNQ